MGGLFISFFLEKFDLFNLFDENLYTEYKIFPNNSFKLIFKIILFT